MRRPVLATNPSRENFPVVRFARAERRVQLQAGLFKGRASAPWKLHFKEANCDDYLRRRACQLQLLVDRI